MKNFELVVIPIVGSIAMLCVFIWGYFKINEPLPPSLTDEQIAAEVRRCNSMGLVLTVYMDRRTFRCDPPKTIEVRQ